MILDWPLLIFLALFFVLVFIKAGIDTYGEVKKKEDKKDESFSFFGGNDDDPPWPRCGWPFV